MQFKNIIYLLILLIICVPLMTVSGIVFFSIVKDVIKDWYEDIVNWIKE